MLKKSKKSFTILLLTLFSVMLLQPLTLKVNAEEVASDIPKFLETKPETIGFYAQYKNKTIINNTVITDYNLKLSVYENGEKHVISDDLNLLRGLRYGGVANDYAYFATSPEKDQHIYRANLNTYKLEDLGKAPSYQNGNTQNKEFIVDNNGTLWFTTYRNVSPIYDSRGNIYSYNTNLVVYNNKGFSYETDYTMGSTFYRDRAGSLRQGVDKNMWFFKTYDDGKDNKVFMVTQDNKVVEYPVDINYPILDIYVGANNILYMHCESFVKDGTKITTDKNVIRKYSIADGQLKFMKEFDIKSITVQGITTDSNGCLWLTAGGFINKLENDTFVKKYIINSNMGYPSIYDDKHLVAASEGGIGITIISIDDTNESSSKNKTESSTTPNVQTSNQSANPPAKFTITSDSNTKSAVLSLNTSLIAKDSVNEITPTLADEVKSVDTKFDALAANGGSGALKLNANNVTMELPFSTVDYDGCTTGSYVSVKQTTVSNDSTLADLKSIGRAYDFGLATYKQDGTKLKDIHVFKSGKAKLTVKLSSDDIKNLDTSKLAAFYYNESTKLWENVGGTFDKNTMTFTFETTHFSKYTIGQIPETLPQTGYFINFGSLIFLSGILIWCGLMLLNRRTRVE